MYTGFSTNSSLLSTPVNQDCCEQIHPPSNNTPTFKLPFNNSAIPKENIFCRIADYFLGSDGLTQDKWQQKSLPPLGEEPITTINKTLSEERKIVINNVEIKFTLKQLFNKLLSKNSLQKTANIENIQLVGGAVPWVLSSYLPVFFKHLGIENPREWLSDDVLKEYARPPKDYDFRIHVPDATIKDVEALKKCILEFFVEAGIEQNPSFEKKELRQLLLQHGFTNYTRPKDLDKSLFSTVGFVDVDLVIYQKLPRTSLFLSDGLFLPLIHILKNENLPIIPLSDFRNGCDSIFDRLSGIVRAKDPQTINCAGWPCLLINYLKGKRCLASDLEAVLLNKTQCTLKGSYAETDCPEELLKELRKIENAPECERKACVLAFWLKKSLLSHLNKDPSAALALILQACISLKKHSQDDVIFKLWILLKPYTEGAESHPILAAIIKVMDTGPGSFHSLSALLQVKALLYLNAAENDLNFNAKLIMHQGSPAIQISMGNHFLLLPYTPSKALIDLKTWWEADIGLETLETLLQPKNPYVKQEGIPLGVPIIWGIKCDFSTPWDRMAAECFIASEIQHPSTNGAKLIEDFMPDLLSHIDRKQTERLLLSASAASSSLEKTKLFSNIRRTCTGKAYATIPMPLIVAMSLAAVGDPPSAYKAYTLWKANPAPLPLDLKISFTKTFIQQLSHARPDLAIDVLSHLQNLAPSFQEGAGCLKGILDSKNKSYLTKRSLLQLVKAASKIYEKQTLSSNDVILIQNLIEKLTYFKKECYQEIKCLWWLIYKETSVDIEKLKEPFQFHEELLFAIMNEDITFKHANNYLELLSTLKPAQALLWRKLFEHLKTIKNSEVHLKAWNFFLHFLENKGGLKGTPQEIEETWLAAIKTMADKNASCLHELLGRENLLILLFKSESANLNRIAQVLFNATLYACTEDCPQETLEKLLKLRQEFEIACRAPVGQSKDWKTADTVLAGKLRANLSVPLNIAALKIYIRQGNLEESGNIIQTFIKNRIPPAEQAVNFVEYLILYLSKLPKEKHAIASKILQTQHVGDLLQQAPSESFKMICGWREKAAGDKTVTSTFNHTLLKQVVNLAPFVDSSELTLWVKDLVHYLESLSSIRSDFRKALSTSHDKLLEIIIKECGPATTLKFLQSLFSLSVNVSFNHDAIDHYYNMFLNISIAPDDKVLLEIRNTFSQFKNAIKEENKPENDVKVLFSLINLCRKKDLAMERVSLTHEFLCIVKSNDLQTRLGPLLAHTKNLFPEVCHNFIEIAINSKENDPEIAVASYLFVEIFIKNNILEQPLAATCWGCILIHNPLFAKHHHMLLKKVDHFIQAFDAPFMDHEFNQLSVTLLGSTLERLNECKAAGRQKIIEDWIKADEKLEPHYLNTYFEKPIKKIKAHIFALSEKTDQHVWGMNALKTQISNLGFDDLASASRNFLLMLKCSNIENFEQALHQLIKKSLQILRGEASMPDPINNLLDYVFINSSLKTALKIFSLFQETPVAHGIEICSLCIMSVLMYSGHQLNREMVYELLSHLNNFLETAMQNKYVFSSNYFEKTTTNLFTKVFQYPLEALKEKLILDILSNLISINHHFLSVDHPNLDNKPEKYQKLLNMISKFLPFFCEESTLLRTHLKTACTYFEYMLDHDPSLFDMGYHSLKESVNNLLKIKPNLSERFSISLHSLFINNLLSIKYAKTDFLNSVTNVIKNEMLSFINHTNIQAEDVKDNLFNYAFYLYRVNPHFLDVEDLKKKNLNKALLNFHPENVIDVLEYANKKELIPVTQTFQYTCLSILNDTHFTSVRLTDEQKNSAFKELVDTLLEQPSHFGITKILIMLHHVSEKHNLTKSTLTHCWQVIFKAAARVKDGSIMTKSVFAVVLDHFWKTQNSAAVCETIFNELLNPNLILYNEKSPLPPLEVVTRIKCFLEISSKNNYFNDEIEHYFKLVDQLMVKFRPTNKDTLEYIDAINKDIPHLITMVNNKIPPEKIILSVKLMSKWVKLLSDNSICIANNTLLRTMDLYGTFPEELKSITAHLHELAPDLS